MSMKFNTTEINALKEAIKEYQGREGNFNSSAPEVEVLGKLSSDEKEEFNTLELKDYVIYTRREYCIH